MRDPNDGTAAALARAVVGQFAIEREIGRGGMGVVYLARDEQLHRAVAIKTLPPHLSYDPQVRARFLREARTAAALSHPNIVPVFSAAERDAVVYFAMGYVEGESLADRLARDGPMPAAAIVPIIRQLASALGYAHEQGVVHRDVKAENILLDAHGRVMVTDFGIARVTEAQPLTATGTVLGTVQYMSPEQVSGEPLDGRSDLYAIGVLMFFAVSGRFPFERPSASAVLVAHVIAPAPRLRDLVPDVPSPFDDLVATLLAKSPDQRLSSARDLLTALAFMSSAVEGGVDSRTLARAPVVPLAFPSPLSSADAQQVWARAAELQANTGAMVPPAHFEPSPASETRGYTSAVVREAAVDAGIDAKYVERALVERAAAGIGPVQVPVQRGDTMTRRPNVFLGARTKLELSASFDGELHGDGFEEVADEIRLALGEMVTVSAVGRTLTVTTGMPTNRQGGMPRFIQVHLASRNGRTTVRAFEDMTQLAGGLFGGLGAGLGVGGGAMMAGILAQVAAVGPALAVAAAAGTLLAAFSAARFFFKRTASSRQDELEQLVRRVIARVRESRGSV
ncbi:serine/threonine-protein kinase [Gemmatimonas sp.]|uniref:serine/threonine-protein kinase n=1 Tax=Gemmatimonas sp. TaxID=1962908 RepID=UPI003983A4D3